MTGRALIDIRKRKFRNARGYGKDAYFHSHFDDEKVSNRLPRRPRLRIEGLAKEGLPVDLVPAINASGNVVPDTWVLPLQRDPRGEWQTRYGSTSAIIRNVERRGMKARVLTV